MKAMIVSLESFQKGEVPEEVKEYIARCGEIGRASCRERV